MTMEPTEIDAMIGRLIDREGGFVDHPSDAGGATKFGITLATLRQWRGKPVTADDVRQLDKIEATAIYRSRFVEHRQLRLQEWPYRRLAEVTLDASIMFSDGPGLAVRWVQEAINARGGKIKADGWAGRQTWAAMVLIDERALVAHVVAARCRRHAEVVASRPGQVVFLVGWINRATAWLMGGEPAERLVPRMPEPEPPAEPDSPSKWPIGVRRWVVRRIRERHGDPEYWTGLHVGPQRECNAVCALDITKAERWVSQEAAEAAIIAYDRRMVEQGFEAVETPA